MKLIDFITEFKYVEPRDEAHYRQLMKDLQDIQKDPKQYATVGKLAVMKRKAELDAWAQKNLKKEDMAAEPAKCTHCDGTGKHGDKECSVCGGRGFVTEDNIEEGHYPHIKSFDKLYGINDVQKYKDMADDAQSMDMEEFVDTYNNIIDMAGDFWEDHQTSLKAEDGVQATDKKRMGAVGKTLY